MVLGLQPRLSVTQPAQNHLQDSHLFRLGIAERGPSLPG